MFNEGCTELPGCSMRDVRNCRGVQSPEYTWVVNSKRIDNGIAYVDGSMC